MKTTNDHDLRHHTQDMQRRSEEMIDHLRADIEKMDEPQLKGIFETSTEVLGGLKKTFSDCESKSQSARR